MNRMIRGNKADHKGFEKPSDFKVGVYRSAFVVLMGLTVLGLGGCGGEEPERSFGDGVQEEGYSGEIAGVQGNGQAASQKSGEAAPQKEELFSDKGFGQLVCDYLSIPEGASADKIRKAMAEAVTLEVKAPIGEPVRSLEDLHYFTSLEELIITYYDWEEGGSIRDLTGIRLAENLKIIYMESQRPENLSFLEPLQSLRELYLVNCGIRDISKLEALPRLERLSLYGNEVADISVLEKLPDLVELTFNDNKKELENYEVLGSLTHMENLGLSHCGIRDIGFVTFMPELKEINLNYNEIEDLSPLEGHDKLERLGLVYNKITDISILGSLTSLYDLSLDGNKVEDIEPLKNLTDISILGLSENPVRDLSCLSDKKELFWLNISMTPVEKTEPVLHVPMLQFGGGNVLESEREKEQRIQTAQSWIEENVSGIDFYTLDDVVEGDLDCDGRKDLAIVLSEMILSVDEENAGEDNRERDRKEKDSQDGNGKEKDSQDGNKEGADREERDGVKDAGGEDNRIGPTRVMPGEDGDYFYGERELLLLLAGKDRGYRPLEHELRIGSFSSGGMRGDPYRGLLISAGTLLLQEAWGSRSGCTSTQCYRYRGGGLELEQETEVYDDNFAYGYDVTTIRYPEDVKIRSVYASDNTYHYTRLSLEGSDKLVGAPLINLFNGSYFYFEEKRSTRITPEEALELAAEEFGRLREELSIPVQEGEKLQKTEIGYTAELKESYEGLKGVELPDYCYMIGEKEEPDALLGYNYYGGGEENPAHVIYLNYYDVPGGSQNTAFILVDDKDGTVKLEQ